MSDSDKDENNEFNPNEIELDIDLDEEESEDDTAKDNIEAIEKDPLLKLQEENTRVKNEYLYLRAEFDNFRKNSIKERSELIKYGPERLVTQLLNVLDIFDKALDSEVTNENIDGFVDGIKMTSKEMVQVLKKFNVVKVDSLNIAFDPAIHEALGSEESEDIKVGHITQVFKSPYKFHDKIIRHGQVIVAKESTQSDKLDSDEETITEPT